MKIDSIILDVDGTIWNTTGIVAEAWNKVIDENFPQVPHVTAEILKGQFGKTMDVICTIIRKDDTLSKHRVQTIIYTCHFRQI